MYLCAALLEVARRLGDLDSTVLLIILLFQVRVHLVFEVRVPAKSQETYLWEGSGCRVWDVVRMFLCRA